MTNIVVAFSKPEDAKSIKNIVMKNGFRVVAVCTSGAQTISSLEGLNGGIVISGYRFEDMLFKDLYADLPENFEMLLVASQNRVGDDLHYERLVYLPMPLKVHDLVTTLAMMCEAQSQRKKKQKQKPQPRSEEDRLLINQAKELLMARNHMTESEAHRYLQKCSMDSGTGMVETAQMVISLIQI